MRLPKDILSGRAKKPEFYLCQADKSILGGLNVTNASATFKFNSYGEIKCEVNRLYQHPTSGEMVENPLYDKVEALRLLYIIGFGYFQIQESTILFDGIREYKDVLAYSLEYSLCHRYLDNFMINLGIDGAIDGVKLLNQADLSHSLIHLILDKLPDWSVGHVDLSVQDKQRSFEIDHQTIYDFLLNDVSDTFGVVFEFDTINNVIDIYDEETYALESNIYVSMDTIANSVEISYNADDIKTRLYVYGADDISIREVNLGLEYITNINYYCTEDWLGKELYDAYTAYSKLSEQYREEFSELMLEWASLYDQYSDLYNKIPDYDESYEEYPIVYSKSDLPAASEKNVYMVYKVVEGNATWYYKCKSEVINGSTVYSWVLDVDNISSFMTFPTPSIEYVGGVYKVYNSESANGVLYYICESYQMNNWTTGYRWVLAEDDYGINMLKEKEQVYLTIQEIHVSAGFAEKTSDQYDRYLENYEKLLEIQALLKEENAKAKTIKSQLDAVLDKMNDISEILALENNFTPEQIRNLNPFIREDELKDDHFLITNLDNDKSAMEVKQELLESADKELAKISQPQLSFSMNLANILDISEFEPVIDNFETGNNIAVEIRPDYVVKTQILEINLNFDDLSDFSVTFGNLSSLYSQTDIHSALLSQAVAAGKSVAESGSYWNKGANTAYSINSRIAQGLIDANTSIKSTENQAISWDSHGLHLRKYSNEEKTEYEDDQIWMNNQQIVFSDDNWRTAKMAIGKIFDSNLISDLNPLGEAYGIIAPNIIGTLLAGENLVIDSSKPDGTLSSFRVDANGARLYNSTFLMEKEVTGTDGSITNGQIMIDPAYGIVAGSDIYITKSDGTIVPAFVDTNGNIQKDGLFPLNSNFFLDINDGNAYFRGYVYAEDGYFSGTITSATIQSATGNFSGNVTAESGNIGGWVVKKGILYSTGTSSSEKNFVGLSSKYDTNDKTTDYAIWAGAMSPTDAPFWVKRDGSIYAKSGTFSGKLEAATGTFSGELQAAKGTFSGELSAATGSFTGDVNATTFKGDISGATGTFSSQINVGDNFIVDSSGNVTINGNINMSSGNINWGGNYPGVTEDEVNDLIDANKVVLPDYIQETYIDFNKVSSPHIEANEIGLYGGYFNIYNSSGTTPYGSFGYGQGFDGKNTTYGVVMSSGNNTGLGVGDYYAIVTDLGVRLQAGQNSIYVTAGGCFTSDGTNSYEIGTGTCVFG